MLKGLHDNPWICDCRLFDLVQFQKSPSSAVAFIDTRLRCAEPESLSGVLFGDAELRRCQAPRVHTAVARVRSSVGNNVLLRCGTVGVPIPELTWSRADGKAMNGTGERSWLHVGVRAVSSACEIDKNKPSVRYITVPFIVAMSKARAEGRLGCGGLSRSSETILCGSECLSLLRFKVGLLTAAFLFYFL